MSLGEIGACSRTHKIGLPFGSPPFAIQGLEGIDPILQFFEVCEDEIAVPVTPLCVDPGIDVVSVVVKIVCIHSVVGNRKTEVEGNAMDVNQAIAAADVDGDPLEVAGGSPNNDFVSEMGGNVSGQ